MSVQRFTATGRTTINWASGTSTEIFIHPQGASFAARDFLFRISTATVEAEESTFTFFEGITRHLMILKGTLELIHEGRYTKQLAPYDQDTFSGEWSTRSKGKVTDFNLMLREGWTGSLEHRHVPQGKAASFTAATAYYFLYIAAGTLSLNDGSSAQAGDLLRIQEGSALSVVAAETSDVIVIEVLPPVV